MADNVKEQQLTAGDDVMLTIGAHTKHYTEAREFVDFLMSEENVHLQPGKGAELIRAAGASAQVLGQEGKYVLVRLQSGEVRMILGTCRATIGTVGNEQQSLVNLGKAGRSRWMGIRPTVRGSVMNPNDHPHGGGEGKAPVGRKAPSTPWGKPALGLKTRNKKAKSDKLIVRRRNDK